MPAIAVTAQQRHLEQQSVAAADGQGGNLWQRVGPRLKDDEQHADGGGDLRGNQREPGGGSSAVGASGYQRTLHIRC